MYKIVNIRGTHGSGKSHIIRRLLDLYDWEPVGLNNRGHPLNHLITNSSTGPIYVVGGYTNVCGGCDGTQPYSLIWPRVQEFADRGHVLFEGALISCSYGSIGRSSEAYGDRFIFAFINTPFDLCVARVKERRAKVRNPKPFDPPPKPFDPKNTLDKYQSIQRSIPKIRDEFKRQVVIIDHRRGVTQVLSLLRL